MYHDVYRPVYIVLYRQPNRLKFYNSQSIIYYSEIVSHNYTDVRTLYQYKVLYLQLNSIFTPACIQLLWF